MAFNNLTCILAAMLLFAAPAALADGVATETEIDHLIEAIGDSGCVFVRNGKRHTAEEAEYHIRSKYRRAKRYATTTELFIERLASRSSMSRKPYWMECPGEARVQSGDWLFRELARYRENTE